MKVTCTYWWLNLRQKMCSAAEIGRYIDIDYLIYYLAGKLTTLKY